MGGFDGQLRARKENDEALLEHAHVALVPGAAFLDEGFCRLSYATSMENIEEGLRRIAAFVKELE